ncbi:MAG: hypothetical protein CMJ78_19670 [Planctomycetaceae bacterium]|nr:hypothetical protein [Planctomycetaceae bacterium]
MDTVFWGALLRFAQAFIQATPTILVGLIVAGVFRRLLGYEGTRRLFGNNSRRSLLQAWAVGMLLPVCSLGVIPVMREMRRAGVSGGAILAFGLTAPLFNPISVLYGLTLSDPIVILTFSFCSLLIVTVMGIGWDKLFPNTSEMSPDPPKVALGIKRMLSVGIYGAREVIGANSLYIFIALIGVAVLSVLLPQGFLQDAAEHNDPWAPLFMTWIAIPIYATPMTAMVQLAAMFQHGNSVGAAFALLALGAGANIGILVWMVQEFSLRKTATWFALLVSVVILLSYTVDKPLYPRGVEPIGHTHAFDIYCAPFHSGINNAFPLAVKILREKTAPHELVSMLALSLLIVTGIVLHFCDRQRKIEAWLERQPEAPPSMDLVIPGPVLGAISLVGLIGLSVLGCYVYYPPPSEILEEMRIANTEVSSATISKDWDTAQYWIPIYDNWSRKLQVSMYLRGQTITPFHRAKSRVLRDKLESLKHGIESEDVEDSRKIGIEVTNAFYRMKHAYAQ